MLVIKIDKAKLVTELFKNLDTSKNVFFYNQEIPDLSSSTFINIKILNYMFTILDLIKKNIDYGFTMECYTDLNGEIIDKAYEKNKQRVKKLISQNLLNEITAKNGRIFKIEYI